MLASQYLTQVKLSVFLCPLPYRVFDPQEASPLRVWPRGHPYTGLPHTA